MIEPNNKQINEGPFKSEPKLDKTAAKPESNIPDSDFAKMKLSKKPKTFSSNRVSFPEIESKLETMYNVAADSKISQAQLQQVKIMLDNFLQGQDLNLNFQFGQPSKINELVVRGLINIYANSTDINMQVRAKEAVSKMLNPLLNEVLAKRIIETYNGSQFAKYPVTKITDAVKWALEKSFEMYFTHLWEKFLKTNVGPNNTFIAGNLIALVYTQQTGSGGKLRGSWFADYYNNFMDNPAKFTPQKAQNPSAANLDKSSQTVSDIIKYVYSVGGKFDPELPNRFNMANRDIVDYLKKELKNPIYWKIFQYIVGDKLDAEEIVDIDGDYFSDGSKVTGAFKDLAKVKRATDVIDMIYKNHKLKLPPFSSWKTSDFIKSPSSRGELKPEPAEFGVDDSGNLSKISYDKFGDKKITSLKEVRLFIREILNNI